MQCLATDAASGQEPSMSPVLAPAQKDAVVYLPLENAVAQKVFILPIHPYIVSDLIYLVIGAWK